MNPEKIKTQCCKSKWYRKGRADFRCKKCDTDVTLQIMLIYQAMEDEHSCKHVKRFGESCRLNNDCKYPNCE